MKHAKWISLILFLVLFLLTQNALGQTVEEEAKTVIANLDGQIRCATESLHFYWDNITDETRYEVLEDTKEAWEHYGIASSLYDLEEYNASLEHGYWANLLAHRAIYRIFLNIAEIHIEHANTTINDIPSYIPQPPEAKNKLKQASELYDEAYLRDVFKGLPSVEEAPNYINAIHSAKDKLYRNYETNVVILANEALNDALDWKESYEASIHPQVRDKVNNVSSGFYFHLVLPFILGLISSSLFCVTLIGRFVGWLRKKSSRKILWRGELWKKRELSSILATLTTLGVFSGLLWEWIGSFRALPKIYEISIPTELVDILNWLLWPLIGLLVASVTLLIINKFRWQKRTGLLFTIVLGLEILLSLIIVGVGWESLGQISHVALL